VSGGTKARRLGLAGELTIRTAAEEKAGLHAFLDVVEEGSDVELDLSGVTELDTAGVQLLLMAGRDARAQGRQLRLVEPSPTVIEVLTIAHLSTELEPLSSPWSRETEQ
jgi:anti-sigma B factor antagonist